MFHSHLRFLLPEKWGGYKNVRGLKVDPEQRGNAHTFRPWGWRVVLLVSEHLEAALEAEGITGLTFLEV